ncbi:ECF transporter S component [Clostridium sediminicola]|uniref:CD3073 family putative ECF transporter S component n=1 Tax=Clostridium sediminicola TaxID=3114879 RepID=UPI0031F25DB1
MKNSPFKSTNGMIFASLGIVINIVLGTIVQSIQIPLLFLDTIGTIFVAAVLGPFAGALTGGLTNIIQGMITNPKNIPFAIVNVVIGLIVGFIAKRYKFNLKIAVITGLILSIVAPLIGTPIAVFVYGGLAGGGTDLIFAWLLASGQKIFTAAFIPRVAGNIIDKIASCVIVAGLLRQMPKNLVSGNHTENA